MDREEQLRDRLLGYRPTDRLLGWLGPLVFTVLGGILRFWQLGRPHQLVFDETYYVKGSTSILWNGVEMRVPDSIKSPDVMFTKGSPSVFGTEGDMVVHPQVGKWVGALGQWVFGVDSSFGWRFSVALLGTLSILVIGRLARRMFGSSLLGTLAAFLTAFEGHHFVQSRTMLLDPILMFFVLVAFYLLVLDRDRSRAILARKVASLEDPGATLMYGPWLGWRPLRLLAGIVLGLSCGVKWSGLYFIAAFGLMTVLWDMGARRTVGVRHWIQGAVLRDGLLAFVVMVPLALATYLLSWTGWFVSDNGYNRHWAEKNPGKGITWLPDDLRSLAQYHKDVWDFAYNLKTPHDYMSNAWGWLVQSRPTSFFYEGPKKGEDGCTVELCSKAISSVGTVTFWWVGVVALVFCVYWWLFRRDWRAGAILAGMAGGYLPWFQYQHRTVFGFYEIAFEPFVILAVTFLLGLVLGPRTAPTAQRRTRLMVVGGYLLLTFAVFVFFYPIYTAQVIPQEHWSWRMWFPSWV
ncbi:MAG: phospholipid carrier-dependent glycosyltransferase [Micrococcales bacterium]|nr:phospholipid carrier-dependent glycosyltransferase [Micrococcales bacterium]